MEFEDPFEFFKLPVMLQYEYLLKSDFRSIQNLCSAAALSKDVEAVRFFQSFCNSYEFWRMKFRQDFPELYEEALRVAEGEGLSEQVKYWRDEYKIELKDAGFKMVMAIRENNIPDVRRYLRIGVDTEVLVPYGIGYDDEEMKIQEEEEFYPRWTPLMWASFLGNEEIVRDLIQAGADINFRSPTPPPRRRSPGRRGGPADLVGGFSGTTALILASGMGHFEIVQDLLRAGADPNKSNEDGFTPLEAASKSGNLDLFRELINNGANLSMQGGDALLRAAELDRILIVEELLKLGVDPNHENMYGSALHAAADYGYTDILEMLLEYGADTDIQAKLDESDWTALMLAAEAGREDITRILLENGADVWLKDSEGETALDVARKRGHPKIVKMLEEAMRTPSSLKSLARRSLRRTGRGRDIPKYLQ